MSPTAGKYALPGPGCMEKGQDETKERRILCGTAYEGEKRARRGRSGVEKDDTIIIRSLDVDMI
jgi:hypothetical protein